MARLGRKPLFWITILYFVLPFINIAFAMSALLCMFFPFYLVGKTRKKTWCSDTCPRADFLSLFKKVSFRSNRSSWMKSRRIRDGILTYFCINIMFIALSTFMVSSGEAPPIDKVRLFMLIQLPWSFPQLTLRPALNAPLLHFSYRMYSVMLSSTLLGVVFALFYKPRTWCTVCPVSTMTGRMLQTINGTTKT